MSNTSNTSKMSDTSKSSNAKRSNAVKSKRAARKKAGKKSVKKASAESAPAAKRIKLPQEPKTRKGLNRAAHALLGATFPDEALCPHHDAPLDYLEASFLKQQDLLVWANRGGGKTMLAAAATLFDALYRAPIKIRVLGGSFDQSDRLAEYIREFMHRRPELLDEDSRRPRRDRVVTYGGSEIRMLAQSERAVRGQHVQKIRCDEVDLFDSDVWQAVQFATRSENRTRGSIEVLSTLHRRGGLMDELVRAARENPTARDAEHRPTHGYRLINWCLWEVIERCPPERKCKDCPLAEDCKGIARRGKGFFRIDDAVAIKARSSRAAWESEMLCLGPARQHVVFEEFNPARHVRSLTYCPDWPMYRAIDFGYASPLVCLWIQVTPSGCVHVLDEYIRARLPLATHAEAILAREPARAELTYCDPAGRQHESTSGTACTDILRDRGMPCMWRRSNIVDGLELIRAALAPAVGEPTLYIDPSCGGLIDSLSSYHYPAPGKGDPETPVKDGPDHAVDALRYFFVNRMPPTRGTQRGRY